MSSSFEEDFWTQQTYKDQAAEESTYLEEELVVTAAFLTKLTLLNDVELMMMNTSNNEVIKLPISNM